MSNTPLHVDQGDGLPASLRFLKGLVITLMITMILGVITVVFVLVTRMPDGRAQIPVLPPTLTLPAGEKAQAVTFGPGWSAVVTESAQILIFDSKGTLTKSLSIAPLQLGK